MATYDLHPPSCWFACIRQGSDSPAIRLSDITSDPVSSSAYNLCGLQVARL